MFRIRGLANVRFRPIADVRSGWDCDPMKRDHVAEFKLALIGRECSIKRDTSGWRADFDDQTYLSLRVPWRIVTGGRVAFGHKDDGHWFGLAEPVDGEKQCALLIGGRVVRLVEIDEGTGDLRITFDNDARIDAFHLSGGYEGWAAGYAARGERWSIIALGGGELAVVPG